MGFYSDAVTHILSHNHIHLHHDVYPANFEGSLLLYCLSSRHLEAVAFCNDSKLLFVVFVVVVVHFQQLEV